MKRPALAAERRLGPLAIQSVGLFTSAGGSAPTALGSARLGLKFFEELPARDDVGEPIVGGKTHLDLETIEGVDRLVTMAALALQECAASAGTRAPLLLCLPGTGSRQIDPARVLALTCERMGARVDAARSRAFPTGRAAIFDGLDAADELLANGTSSEVFVGGVDSLVDLEPLDRLLREGRVRTSTADGLVPGEGAAFLRLSRGADARALALITACARKQESAVGDADSAASGERRGGASTGAALAQAGRAALGAASLTMEAVGAIVHDASGDRRSFREAAMALTRLGPRVEPAAEVWIPASSAGELGAAYGPFALALAAQILHKNLTPGPAVLVLGTGDGAERGAAVVIGATGNSKRGRERRYPHG